MYPVVLLLVQFLVDVYEVFDSRDVNILDSFINKYSDYEIDEISGYAKGLTKDYEAVKNSLLYGDISNGPLEGVNSRIKEIHRRSKGQAGLFLLNAYMILPSASI